MRTVGADGTRTLGTRVAVVAKEVQGRIVGYRIYQEK